MEECGEGDNKRQKGLLDHMPALHFLLLLSPLNRREDIMSPSLSLSCLSAYLSVLSVLSVLTSSFAVNANPESESSPKHIHRLPPWPCLSSFLLIIVLLFVECKIRKGILDRRISYCSVGSMLIISSKKDSRRPSVQKGLVRLYCRYRAIAGPVLFLPSGYQSGVVTTTTITTEESKNECRFQFFVVVDWAKGRESRDKLAGG